MCQYDYSKEKPVLFTECGLARFLSVRDEIFRLLKITKSFRVDSLMENKNIPSIDLYFLMVILDYMIERNEILEVTGNNALGLYRVFQEPISF